MNIDPVRASRAFEINARKAQQKPKAPAQAKKVDSDTYEPAPKQEPDRAALLANIRKKIKSGYYNSEEVMEDLGDSFAKVFDKGL